MAAPQPPNMAAAAPAPVFALGPGHNQTPLDFTDATAVKVFHKAIQPLSTVFDGKQENILPFLSNLQDRARNFGWQTILDIPVGGRNLNIISDYGSVTIADVTTHVATYSGQPTRQAQNSEMLFHCLKQSLTSRFTAEVLIYKPRYHVDGVRSGALLLKQISTLIITGRLHTFTTL